MGDKRAREPTVSIVMPVLNEAIQIEAALRNLSRFDTLDEVIVVDGGSNDTTGDVVSRLISQTSQTKSTFRFTAAPRSRALQMNTGAWKSECDVLSYYYNVT